MRVFLVIILLLTNSIFCFATHSEKIDSVYFAGSVIDGFNGEPILGNHIFEIRTTGNKLIADSVKINVEGDNGRFVVQVPMMKYYSLTFIVSGYDNKVIEFKPTKLALKPGALLWLPDVEMFPKMNAKLLNEVTATATRVKMVMKGDTIEYNAAAFQLSEGSMLDNLVKALPGAELHENGRITVNGEFVSSLMVNGRDFFKGDPRVALSNLPAYTVNKIQVYRKADEMKSMKGLAKTEGDPLVMDVKLKREYAKGLISNYEVGLGSTLYDRTKLKWLGRVFAMYYTPVQSIAVYANANNLNDTREASSSGTWRKTDPGSGEITVKSAGVDYSNENKSKRLSFNTTLQAERRNVKLGRQTFTETYLEGGNTFSRSASNSHNNSTELKWNGNMNKKWDWGWLNVKPAAFYHHNSCKYSENIEKTDGKEGITDGTPLLYSRKVFNNQKEERWGVSLSTDFAVRSPLKFANRYVLFNVFGKYNSANENANNWDYLHYPLNATYNLDEQQQGHQPSHSYHYGASFSPLSFRHSFGSDKPINGYMDGHLTYSYEQEHLSGSRALKRREVESGVFQEQIVPSAANTWVLDEINSYSTTRLNKKNSLSASFILRIFKAQLQMDLPLEFHNRTINDYRYNELLRLNKNDITFQPIIALYSVNKSKIGWRISWSLRQILPEMMEMLQVSDTSNPLLIRLGNPQLTKASVHNLKAEISQEGLPHMQRWSISAGYEQANNLIALAQTYDRQSGLTTLQPRNINGNFNVYGNISYQRALDRRESFYFSNSIIPTLMRSVDYSSDNNSGLDLLKVNNYRISEKFKLTWRHNAFSVNGIVDLKWNRLVSLSDVFAPFSYLDVNYGVSATSPLVWGIDLDTELMAYCRRGYAEKAMNTTDWVWNLTLSKAFGKSNQWVVKAIGFDILHQLPNTQRSVNAQGRTEIRYNTVSSYALLSLTYRLDIKPKKK